MKTKLLIYLLFVTVVCANAQVADTVAYVNIYGKPIATNNFAKSNTKVYYDLIITDLKVELPKKHRIGSTKLKRIIKYTIKNTGSTYVKLADVFLQGYVSNNSTATPENMISTGGDWATKSKFVLPEGKSYSSYFICDYNTFWNEKLYFLLKVDAQNLIIETDETNNTMLVQLNFIKEK